MKRLILLGTLAVMSCLGWASPSSAISIGFSPISQTTGVGDTLSVDVVVAGLEAGGLDEIVSAFDLDVTYDPAILSASGVTFGPYLGDPIFFEAFTDFNLSTAGVIDFAEISLLDDATLAAMQADSFSLATLSFSAIAPGTSQLGFVFNGFNDMKGLNAEVLALDVRGGSVDVAAAVPEPGSLLLLSAGTAGMFFLRKKIRVC